jgi:hypothetical protein
VNGEALGAQAIAEAQLRRRATEQSGPRPGGVRREAQAAAPDERIVRATRP